MTTFLFSYVNRQQKLITVIYATNETHVYITTDWITCIVLTIMLFE